MRKVLLIFLPLLLALGGCDSMSPEISKDSMGNLEVYVSTPPGIEAHPAKIYVDDIFVGNVSERLPVLYLKRGRHIIRVELAGLQNYRQMITILGEPNHQFLYVPLRP